MSKDIKDYLHLYLMQKYIWKDEDGEWRRPGTLTAYQLNGVRQTGVEVKLILRPLSDMTDEEKMKLYGFGFTCNERGPQIKAPEKWQCFKPEQLKYLLSKGFDLFELIPAGLAIDKTTI